MGLFNMNLKSILNTKLFFLTILTSFVSFDIFSQEQQFIEDIIVTAEKRNESLQTVSQAVTAITDSELDAKNITSFVDLTAVVPGVTVAKNEGYKTVISIRGVGNETNQNAIAAPSVAFHMDGIFVASPFSLQTDFVDVERIEVLRGPQGTLFGQNSTGGAINVISKKPSSDDFYAKTDITVGDYDLMKVGAALNFPISDKLATKLTFSSIERDGFAENLITGQDLDDASSISIRSDWIYDISDTSSLRIFGQYFDSDRNGAAMKGKDDLSSDARKLSQDTISKQELSSKIFALIYESDLGYANLKVLASIQEDDILVVRDNDRHAAGVQPVLSMPGLPYIYIDNAPYYPMAEFNPETSLVDTDTFEINLISNEPALNGKLDWTFGAFYLKHKIENHIRGYVDNDLNGEFKYVCDESFANPNYCFNIGEDPFSADFDFVTDAFPERESFSIYGQTTYMISDITRLISGIRFTEDDVTTCNANFFFGCDNLTTSSDKTTGKIALEYDVNPDTMVYLSYTAGYKPGGTNLTYGSDAEDGSFSAMVFETFEPETVDSIEFGIKSDFYDGKARANIAVFSYDYENLQFQATDPIPYQGGVANIPESEMSGVEIEFTALASDNITFDMNLGFISSEVSSDFNVLDNVLAFQYFFGEESLRYDLRENVNGNELAKTPDFTADISMTYETVLSSGNSLTSVLQFVKRGEFMQRVNNNPLVDVVPAYQIFNISVGIDFKNDLSLDFILLNAADEDGLNSAMTDVFGVAATGLEYIPPRQMMTRLSYKF
jgi:iron complex outermembrane receptor protein